MLNTPNMNLNLVRTFVIVGQSKDMKVASERLGMDRSNVSRNITALEQLYGTKLLNNNSKVLELTETGKMIFAYYEKAYNLLFLAEKNYLQSNSLDCAKISIGTSLNSNSKLLVSKIKDFTNHYKNITIKTVHSSSKNLFEKLLHYYFDFLITEKSDDLKKSSGIRYIDLFDEQYCIAYSREKYQIHLDNLNQLSGMPLLLSTTDKKARRVFEKQLDELKIDKRISLESDDDNEVKEYAQLGLGFALLPKRLVENSKLEYFGLDIFVTISIFYMDGNLSPANTEFLKRWK